MIRGTVIWLLLTVLVIMSVAWMKDRGAAGEPTVIEVLPNG